MIRHMKRSPLLADTPTFQYSRWRHGGWYVDNIRYPSGACGCVSRNYPDRKWRIVCEPRQFELRPTFKTRDQAAEAEWLLFKALKVEAMRPKGH